MGNTTSFSKDLETIKSLFDRAQKGNYEISEVELKLLLKGIQSTQPIKQLWALNAIALVCEENDENRDKLGEKGVKYLTHLLKSSYEKVRAKAVVALGNLCIDNPNNQARIAERPKSFTRITRLLSSSNSEVQSWAANSIGLICTDNEKNQDLFAQKGAIPKIVSLLRSRSLDVQKWGVFALGNLIMLKKNRKSFIEENVLTLLTFHLKNDAEYELQRWTANVIAALCEEDNEAKTICGNLDYIEILTSLLKCKDEPILRNVTLALHHICRGNVKNQTKASEKGAVPLLFQALKFANSKDHQLLVQYVTDAILSISTENDDIPEEAKSLIADHKLKRTTSIGRKLINLVDSASTVAVRLPPQNFPSASEVFDEEMQETEELGFSEAEESFIEDDSFVIKFEDLSFDEENIVGFGSFGNVYRGEYLGTEVAIKELINVENEVIRKLLMREIDTLKNIRHPNVVQIMGVSKDEGGVYIITEYVDGGDLRKLLKKKEKEISWVLRVKIALDIATALNYLCSKRIMHRDLKSKNILLEGESLKAKLCDFGFARERTEDEMITVKVGTDRWMSPEVIMGEKYDFSADVFSFGVVLCELLTREKPPERLPKNGFLFEEKFLESIQQIENAPEELINLTLGCLQKNPKERPTFAQAQRLLQSLYRSMSSQ